MQKIGLAVLGIGAIGLVSSLINIPDPHLVAWQRKYKYIERHTLELILDLKETCTHPKMIKLVDNILKAMNQLSQLIIVHDLGANYKAQALRKFIDNNLTLLENFSYPIKSMNDRISESTNQIREESENLCYNINQEVINS